MRTPDRLAGGQRAESVGSALLERPGVAIAHRVGQRSQPTVEQRGIGLVQLTRKVRGAAIVRDIDMPAPRLGFGSPPRIWVVTADDAVDHLLHLVDGDRGPGSRSLGEVCIDGRHDIGVHSKQRAGHDHPDRSVVDGTGGEDGGYPGQPLMQADRVMQQRAGCGSRDRLGSGHLGGHRLPGVDSPQLASVLDLDPAPVIQLGDRRQPARAGDVLGAGRFADGVDHCGITH